MIDFARSMCRMRDQDGLTIEAIAEQCDVYQATASMLMEIAALTDRPDLPPRETYRIQRAVALMNEIQQASEPYGMIADIGERIWGPRPQRRGLGNVERNRQEQFDRAFGTIMQCCLSASEIAVPHFSQRRSMQIARELTQAIESVERLRAKILEVWS